MAHLKKCSYCGGDVINCSWHAECRAAFCEDLLAQIQKHAQRHRRAALPIKLKDILMAGHFKTKAEHDERVRQADELALEKFGWGKKRNAALQQFLNEWEKEHPNPDPPQY